MIQQINNSVYSVCIYRTLVIKRIKRVEESSSQTLLTPPSNDCIWIGAKFAPSFYHNLWLSRCLFKDSKRFLYDFKPEELASRALLSLARVHKSVLPQSILMVGGLLPHIVLKFWRWRIVPPDSSD